MSPAWDARFDPSPQNMLREIDGWLAPFPAFDGVFLAGLFQRTAFTEENDHAVREIFDPKQKLGGHRAARSAPNAPLIKIRPPECLGKTKLGRPENWECNTAGRGAECVFAISDIVRINGFS